MTDTLYSASESGIYGKRLRMIQDLHENTEISMLGDKNKLRKRIIENSTGQGTNWAPEGCSSTIAMSTEKAIKAVNNEIKINGKNRGCIIFVDDTLRMATDTKMARDGGIVFTESLNTLSLEAHPDKSRIVVMGSKQMREKVKQELEKDPVIVQGWEMKTSDIETYLGFQIDERGVRESINKSIEGRIRGARTKSIQLIKVLDDDKICKLGWLESTKLLFTSIIIPTLTYGSQAYTNMTKKQREMLETAMRECLYRMLGISKTSHYSSVLLELNLIPVNNIIDQLKISFVNSLIHEKGNGVCLETLREEENKYEHSMLKETSKLCEIYGLPNVVEYYIKKETIKERVWSVARKEIWKNAMKNRKIPYKNTTEKTKKNYWSMPRRKAKLLLSYYIGELNMKDYKRHEMRVRFGNTNCLAGCDKPDNLQHVMNCDRYLTKPEKFKLDGTDERLVEYLTELDKERFKMYEFPLTYRLDRSQRAKRRGINQA